MNERDIPRQLRFDTTIATRKGIPRTVNGYMARSYRSIADWEGIYEQIIAEDGGVVPSTLLERRLAKSRQAAWKLLERHRKAGILRRYASPGIHILLTSEPNVNNVRIVENNSNSGASQRTLLISKPHAGHENKPNLSKSAILENTRSQIQTQKTQDSIKGIQWCLRRGGHSYRYSDDLVSHLVSAKDVMRLDALSLPRNSWDIPFISPRLHRLCFETFDERAPFARRFDAVLERNKAINDKIIIMGIPVHVARYFRGKVIIMPYLDEKPLPQSQLRPFLEAVRSALGLEPPIDLWGVTFAEVNADIPLSDLPKEKLYEIFKYRDETLRAYTKNIQGQAYLRIESIIDPDRMKLAQFERKAELASETLQHFAKRLA